MSKKHRKPVAKFAPKPTPKFTAKQAGPTPDPEVEAAPEPEAEPAPKLPKAKKRPVEPTDAQPVEPINEVTESAQLPTTLPLDAFTDAADETPDTAAHGATNASNPVTEPEPTPTPNAPVPAQSQFILCSRRVTAVGELLPNKKFTVKAGSTAVLNDAPSFKGKLRQQLRDSGILVPKDGLLIFTSDYTFQSPSAAATTVAGSPQNGNTAWRYRDQPLKDFRSISPAAPV